MAWWHGSAILAHLYCLQHHRRIRSVDVVVGHIRRMLVWWHNGYAGVRAYRLLPPSPVVPFGLLFASIFFCFIYVYYDFVPLEASLHFGLCFSFALRLRSEMKGIKLIYRKYFQ